MNANQTLQEYADNSGNRLTVDRARGIIPGVKLLGRVSKKGREYPPAVMAKALPLYEGMRVNVDHVDPGQHRSLRDRIGLVKNVTLKEDGLYGDFHFNPKHPLAEQIAWDAENAPQNLGFSHDTRGGSRNQNGKVVVESIDTVLSVDLVANPATTTGLFESTDMDWKDIDIPGLKANRPEIVATLQESLDPAERQELTALRAEKAARTLQESIDADLRAAGLDPANKTAVSQVFMEDLVATADQAKRQAKIADRRALYASGHGANNPRGAEPISSMPLVEDTTARQIPPATAPLTERIRRFVK